MYTHTQGCALETVVIRCDHILVFAGAFARKLKVIAVEAAIYNQASAALSLFI